MSHVLPSLIALCVLLRALVPVGFMPDLAAAREGVFTIVICTADGLSAFAVNARGEPVGPDHERDADAKDHCPFAPIASIVLNADPQDAQPQAFAAADASWSPIEAARHIRHRPTSLRPRAPPAHS